MSLVGSASGGRGLTPVLETCDTPPLADTLPANDKFTQKLFAAGAAGLVRPMRVGARRGKRLSKGLVARVRNAVCTCGRRVGLVTQAMNCCRGVHLSAEKRVHRDLLRLRVSGNALRSLLSNYSRLQNGTSTSMGTRVPVTDSTVGHRGALRCEAPRPPDRADNAL
jgi:hypothetical protein